MNDISTDLSDWESEDDVSELSREDALARLHEMLATAFMDFDAVRAAIRLLEAEPRKPDGWLAYVRYDLGGPDRPMIECDKERLLAALSRIGAPQPEVEK